MTQKATAKKPAKKQIDAVRSVLVRDHDTEVNRAWYVRRALDQVEQELWPQIATAITSDAPDGGLTRHWLVTLGGDGDRATSAHAIAETAASVNGGRAFVTELLTGAAQWISDEALLLRAIENLLIGRPFAPLFLERGVAIARLHKPELARVLQERAAFVANHAALLADLLPAAQEKKQAAAVAMLPKLAGADRSAMATWILTEPGIESDAKKWARSAGFADPAVEYQTITWALNDGSGIYDEEEKQLRAVFEAGGPAMLERATDMVVYAIERQLITAMEHLAEAAPKAFGTTRGFAAVETALAGGGPTAKRICDDMRVLSAVGKAFDDTQAQRLVDVLLGMNPRELEHEIPRAFFYLQHPGSVPALERAFERELSDYFMKCVLDCAAHATSSAAHDLLIGRIWVQHRNQRDLVFSLTRGAIQARHDYLLAELERRPSIHAAWLAVGPQMHWLHRPRAVLDIVERVLAWPALPDAEPRKLAMIYGHAVECALELHRYELGARAYAALQALGDVDPLDPTDPASTKKILDGDKAKLAAKLATGELAAEAAKLREEIATARTANAPIRADDDRIGRLGGCKVHARIHDDANTGETWFIDAEGQYGYYDGYEVVPIDWWQCHADQAYGATSAKLRDFAAGWRVEQRALSIHSGAYREITRSGNKLFGKIWRSEQPAIAQQTFAMTCDSVDRARAIVDSMAATPFKGAKLADPFYVSGKRDGGAVVRNIYDQKDKLVWRLGREVYRREYKWQNTGFTMHATDDEAAAAFDAIENAAMERGCYLWKLELEADLRPLAEKPLLQWIDDRLRDDNQPAGWHLAALPEVRDTLVLSGFTDLEIELEDPASDADLAALDAALPTPMPDALRAMWKTHGSYRWKLGKDTERVLSPREVLSSRKVLRDKLRASMTKLAPKRAAEFPFDHVEIFALDRDGHPTIGFDGRQQRAACYTDISPGSMKSGDWWDSLAWMIAVGPNRALQQALVAAHPAIKKLLYGQSATAKPAKPAGQSARPAAKKPAASKGKPAATKNAKKK